MYSPNFQSGPTKLVGQAFTVKFVLNTSEAAPKLSGNYVRITAHSASDADLTHYGKADQIPRDSVVFMSQPEPHAHAVFGGLMALRSQARGAAGVVIDGRVRDLQEHRNLGITVRLLPLSGFDLILMSRRSLQKALVQQRVGKCADPRRSMYL